MPTDPDELRAWIEALGEEDLSGLSHPVVGGWPASALGLGGGFDRRNREIDLPRPPGEPRLLTVTVELLGSTPKIWRRLSLPGELRQDAAHTLLQAAMGWTDSHLHRFQPGSGPAWSTPYFITEFDEEEEGDEGTREEGVRLDQVLREPGDTLIYLYDFGDGWEHRVTLESVDALDRGAPWPGLPGWGEGLPAGGRRWDPRSHRARRLATRRRPPGRGARAVRGR